MPALPAAVQRYLDRHATQGPWELESEARGEFDGAVVIPALAEGAGIFATLESLAANPPSWLERFLIVVVVNNSDQAAAADRRQNETDLAALADLASRTVLNLCRVDAAVAGLAVPSRQAGVGFARKLGMDLVLPRLDWRKDPLLVCLDADTLVDPGYLQAIAMHFQNSAAGAAVLPFRHQPAADPLRQAAIDRYELFLRRYVYGLRLAGSPYAFHSIGSAIACRASAYVLSGGMNGRKAGEDFYFLQKLAKTVGVERISGTRVYPDSRASNRVPFGTGRSVALQLEGDENAVRFYPAAVFRITGAWLRAVAQDLPGRADTLLLKAEAISPVLADHLEQSGWLATWPRLQENHPASAGLFRAFHTWFDGFRTLRLIHRLCNSGLQRGEPEAMLPDYFARDGLACPKDLPAMLETLRRLDEG